MRAGLTHNFTTAVDPDAFTDVCVAPAIAPRSPVDLGPRAGMARALRCTAVFIGFTDETIAARISLRMTRPPAAVRSPRPTRRSCVPPSTRTSTGQTVGMERFSAGIDVTTNWTSMVAFASMSSCFGTPITFTGYTSQWPAVMMPSG